MNEKKDNLPDALTILQACGIELPSHINRTNISIKCPFCDDKKRHLYFSLENNVFYCQRCSAKGNGLTFYAQMHNITSAEAYSILCGPDFSSAGSPALQRTTAPANPSPLAPVAQRNAVYRALLNLLSLEPHHRADLLARGLTDAQIGFYGIKSMPVGKSVDIAKAIMDSGLSLEGVPGFYKDRKDIWRLRSTDSVNGKMIHPGMSGYLIPVLDSKRRVQGFQLRRDKNAKPKYIWLSSMDYPSGCGAKNWCHYIGAPLNSGRVKEVILTEGALKADIINALSKRSVLALMGVNSTSELNPALERLQKAGVRRIYIAYDMDIHSNKEVMRAFEKISKLLTDKGFETMTLSWPPEHKGLDDYLLSLVKARAKTQK